jgi:hypothetical protein
MLKNNKERREYIDDERNWIICEYLPVNKVNNGERMPIITLKNLKGTRIFKVQAVYGNAYFKPHLVTLGCYRFHDDGVLDEIYSISDPQLVNYLREERI